MYLIKTSCTVRFRWEDAWVWNDKSRLRRFRWSKVTPCLAYDWRDNESAKIKSILMKHEIKYPNSTIFPWTLRSLQWIDSLERNKACIFAVALEIPMKVFWSTRDLVFLTNVFRQTLPRLKYRAVCEMFGMRVYTFIYGPVETFWPDCKFSIGESLNASFSTYWWDWWYMC